ADVALLRHSVPHGIEGLGLIRKHAGREPLLFLPARRMPPRLSLVKRLFDVVFSAAVLGLGLPAWLLVAAAVKLGDRGPVFFVQDRVGAGGRHFRFVKFRTMVPGADAHHADFEAEHREDGHLFKLRDDPRRTAVGRVLRRFSLDEVPQFLHALSGRMSVVGPRPPLPAEVERYRPWQHLRLRGWVGLTGLWQVCGRSEIRDLNDIVLLDALYLHNHSLLLDLRIVLRTIHVILSRRGAY
ncbi:MAG: sugar transferase, partial [Planctomycetota bacterium]